MRARFRPSVFAAFTLALAAGGGGQALGCPSCATGRAARADVWNDGFAENLATACAPFMAIAAVCASIERRRPRPRGPGDKR